MKIEGTGIDSYGLSITKEGQARTIAESYPVALHHSINEGEVYHGIGDYTISGAPSAVRFFFLRNDSTNKYLVINQISIQILNLTGGTAIPDPATYIDVEYGLTYTTGGSDITVVNMNNNSGKVAEVTAKDNNPTVGGTATPVERWYPASDGDKITYQDNEIILGANDTLGISVTSDHTAGTVVATVAFIMIDESEF